MADARENSLRNFLQKIAAEQKYDNPDIELNVVPTTGANFTSQLFHATIKAKDKEELNIFAKYAIVGETMREQSGGIDFYGVEPLFYTTVGKRYRELQDKYNVPDEDRFVFPKFYGYNNDYLNEVLVLEDLSKEGFVTLDRLEPIGWDYASRAIEEMAKFHALSIAHQKEYPEEYEEAKKVFKKMMVEENGIMVDMLRKSIEPTIKMTREENRPNIQKFFSETFDPNSFGKFFLTKKRPVLIHSDYRQSNLLHKIDENGKVQVVPVDYQVLHPGSVANDLLYFIFTGSDGAFREKYYDQLIEHYYENLAAALRRLDLDPEEAFPRKDFDEELKEMLPYGLIIACMFMPIITIDQDQLLENLDEDFYESGRVEDMSDLMKNTNSLTAKRLNEVIDDYVKWGVL